MDARQDTASANSSLLTSSFYKLFSSSSYTTVIVFNEYIYNVQKIEREKSTLLYASVRFNEIHCIIIIYVPSGFLSVLHFPLPAFHFALLTSYSFLSKSLLLLSS